MKKKTPADSQVIQRAVEEAERNWGIEAELLITVHHKAYRSFGMVVYKAERRPVPSIDAVMKALLSCPPLDRERFRKHLGNVPWHPCAEMYFPWANVDLNCIYQSAIETKLWATDPGIRPQRVKENCARVLEQVTGGSTQRYMHAVRDAWFKMRQDEGVPRKIEALLGKTMEQAQKLSDADDRLAEALLGTPERVQACRQEVDPEKRSKLAWKHLQQHCSDSPHVKSLAGRLRY